MIILFGGNGFIGRHLAERASEIGIPAIIISRTVDREFLARHAPAVEAMTLDDFRARPGRALMERAQAFVYLASRTVPGSNLSNPPAELIANVAPAFRQFRRVASAKPDMPIVFVSSGGTVYGPSREERVSEDHPLHPISAYGLGKVLIEHCLRFCCDAQSQPYAILRPSNAVGKWHSDPTQGLVTAALRSIKTGTALQIYGAGDAVRDYIDADDLAFAILEVALKIRGRSGVWNVGSGIGYSVLEVIDIVAELTGRRPEIAHVPARKVDIDRIILDNSAIARDFGWSPKFTLRDAIQKLI